MLCYHFSPDVKLYDYIKEEAGARMVDRIYDLTKEIGTAAEIGTIQIWQAILNARDKPILRFSHPNSIGCNRGFISSHDLADTIGHLYLCESSPTMLEQAEVATGLKVTKLNMDEEMPKVKESIFSIIRIEFNPLVYFGFSSRRTPWIWWCLV